MLEYEVSGSPRVVRGMQAFKDSTQHLQTAEQRLLKPVQDQLPGMILSLAHASTHQMHWWITFKRSISTTVTNPTLLQAACLCGTLLTCSLAADSGLSYFHLGLA
jgi:hypothetical protein